MKLRVFEAFAGIGTQRMALKRLGIDHEVVAIAEIDKFAIRSYEAIHGETYNVGDISEVSKDDIPDHDLFTYSFPCQDISVAGKQGGLDQGSGTRSSLLWECNRVIETIKPKYLLMENVKNLVGKKHKPNFDKWLEHLEDLGYTNYWEVLNAKDYGIPQNRERVFVVSILGEHIPYEFPDKQQLEIRIRDILEDEVDEKFYLSDKVTKEVTERYIERKNKENKSGEIESGTIGALRGRNVENPTSRESGLETKQMLEMNEKGTSNCVTTVSKDNVVVEVDNPLKGITPKGWHFEQQVYDVDGITRTVKAGGGSGNIPKIIEKDTAKLNIVGNTSRTGHHSQNVYLDDGISPTIAARDYKGPKQVMTYEQNRLFGIYDKDGKRHQAGGVYDLNGIAPTLDTMQGGWRQPSVIVAKDEFGRMGKQAVETLNDNECKHGDTINPFNKKVSSTDGISPTLTTRPEGFKTAISAVVEDEYSDIRIRKLTPRECWRLMGIDDSDFEKADEVVSNSQLYKQAGNAIVVDVMVGIFDKLFNVEEV